jgi:hypothetical protein
VFGNAVLIDNSVNGIGSLSANGNGILGGNAIIIGNNVQGNLSGSFNGNGALFGDAEIINNTVLGDGSLSFNGNGTAGTNFRNNVIIGDSGSNEQDSEQYDHR